MPDTNNNTTETTVENGAASTAWPDISGIPTTPVAPPGGTPAYPGNDTNNGMNDDLAGTPTTPVAPPGGTPAFPGTSNNWPDFPMFPDMMFPGAGSMFPSTGPMFPSQPSITYYGQVRFLNASTNGMNLDVLIDGQNVLSGSTFATVSNYVPVTDGFHTVTVRRTNGPILYQQTLAFVSGERVTMVILDNSSGVTLTKVSDMGCTNVPSGFGCLRVANMTYSGSSYDVRLFNNQVVFAGVGFKEVTSFKQASTGNYTFFVTNSQVNVTTFNELPQLIFTVITGTSCPGCAVNNPLLTYSINVQAGRTYTSYIIGNPWSNMYQVFTLED
ncbi:MAG: DUF4397 domain-containing protein [Lachnospiraceae bacterium]|nr:DUF4397 domain-containing protein [Lachnospiraceae bacterium]